MQNEKRRLPDDQKVKNLTRLEFVLTLAKTGQWESFIHNVLTWYYDSFESYTFNSHSLCNQLIDSFRNCVSVVLKYKSMLDKKLSLASLLCIPFQYSLIEVRILRSEAFHRLPFRWQFNLAVKKVRSIFPPATNHGLTDVIFSSHFRVIFNSFFGDYFKFKREVVWRAMSLGHDDNLTWNKRLRTRDCLIDTTNV